ncbi:3-phenylpropionate/trans-cinnamate dioxygenase ferredoxin reductase subunit [Micromonospora viridifaciens]|uniref:3-phenylpropionate/trans-cinnamate dioxygenase ferredoxin reductase subunit n=1 Tax=Micromonospora viridifaciens TaxID=1881 RepID=A0A1C4WY80_MICVI|nr:FAD-dependent oxidoreductase [Micromonospora viridifaciens]SCF01227.1 3-phenylpropionate/trans-cinnamate dioxygenase ferredoxin reductase subunit [Micromonospora viridifaciens]
MVDSPVYVIVGASLTGAKAAEELRTAGFAGRILLIGEETERPYERPPLSKGYLLGTDPRDKAYVHEPGWYDTHEVELLLGVRATGIDRAARTLLLSGRDPVRYDKLLLATGSRARRLDVPGADLPGVRYLRALPDADALLADLRTAKRAVVVGAGWIGLETAAAARHHGADVTVVEVDRAPLRRVLGDDVAAVFAALHRAHGVVFHFGAGVRQFRAGGVGRLAAVVLTDGTELPADLAIVGVGITPATELALAAGLTVDNGIAVDAGLRTSDPDIYAAGDVAALAHPLIDRRIRIEHWSNALNGGKAAARAMLGEPVTYDRVPYFFTDQYDLGMEYAGWVEPGGYDQVVFRGDAIIQDGASPQFLAFWVAGGRVLAGMNVNIWQVQDDIQALVRAGWAGREVDLGRLADSSVPLRALIP